MRNSMAENRDPNELHCKQDKMQTTTPDQAQALPTLPEKERRDGQG